MIADQIEHDFHQLQVHNASTGIRINVSFFVVGYFFVKS